MTGCGKCAGRPIEEALAEAVSCRPDFLPVFALLLHAPWWVCLLASTVFGAIWGAIPGIFKAYLNVNEVITAIMFNWIGLYG